MWYEDMVEGKQEAAFEKKTLKRAWTWICGYVFITLADQWCQKVPGKFLRNIMNKDWSRI